MKIYIVYSPEGDSEVLFEGVFLSGEAAQAYIDNAFTVPRCYAWQIRELTLDDEERPYRVIEPTYCQCELCVAHRKLNHPARKHWEAYDLAQMSQK